MAKPAKKPAVVIVIGKGKGPMPPNMPMPGKMPLPSMGAGGPPKGMAPPFKKGSKK